MIFVSYTNKIKIWQILKRFTYITFFKTQHKTQILGEVIAYDNSRYIKNGTPNVFLIMWRGNLPTKVMIIKKKAYLFLINIFFRGGDIMMWRMLC